jgi:hypothetical protein
MKTLIALLFAIITTAAHADCDKIYFDIGAGYKFDQTRYYNYNGEKLYLKKEDYPISARFDLGVQCGNWSYGFSHHSQWFTGAPFNNEHEIYKNEFFIEYRFEWNI